jgi:hypothetical protein
LVGETPVFKRVEDDKTTVFVEDGVGTERGRFRHTLDAFGQSTMSEEDLHVVVEDGEKTDSSLKDGTAAGDETTEDGVVLKALNEVLTKNGRGGSGSRGGGSRLDRVTGRRIATRRRRFTRCEIARSRGGAGGTVHGVGGGEVGRADLERLLTRVHGRLFLGSEEVETVDDVLALDFVGGDGGVEGAVLEGSGFFSFGGDAVGRKRRVVDVNLVLRKGKEDVSVVAGRGREEGNGQKEEAE